MSEPPRPMKARTGRANQRYSPSGERLVAGIVPLNAAKTHVLLISSTRRAAWVLPKGGWESDEPTQMDAARREAWEEAGIVLGDTLADLGDIEDSRRPDEMTAEAPKGRYHFFEGVVEKEGDEWPEMTKRERRWVTYAQAWEALKGRRELVGALERCSLAQGVADGEGK
ncbi:MAG: hypothetical protein Q9162_007826 [Coniocarpon cinnabarinum]